MLCSKLAGAHDELFPRQSGFRCIEKNVLPQLIENRPAGAPIRIWVAGCSSGEEAYSIAIVWTELCEQHNVHFPLQVFATDTSRGAVQKARAELYGAGIEEAVSAKRLGRFFSFDHGFYHAHSDLRERILFARHTLGVDPPVRPHGRDHLPKFVDLFRTAPPGRGCSATSFCSPTRWISVTGRSRIDPVPDAVYTRNQIMQIVPQTLRRIASARTCD